MGKASRKKKPAATAPAAGFANSPDTANGTPSSNIVLLSLIVVILMGSFAVYFNALSGDFVYDDNSQIVDNPWIKDIGSIPTIFSKSVWSFKSARLISNYYRPLMHIVYMLNYHVFGMKPWGFHLVNILFHCGASVLVFLIIRRCLSASGGATSLLSLSPAFMAAMLFASHPIHTEAVTWIAGLPDVAFTFFYLLSFYLYIKSKAVLASGSYLFSVVCFAIAAFFKEPALTLPVILLAYDYLFREQRTPFFDYVKRYIPYLAIGVGYIALRMHALGDFAPQKRHLTLSTYQYIVNVFPLFMQYLEKLIVPLNLNAFYVFHPVASLFQFKAAFSFIATVVFAVLFLIAFKKNRVAFLGLLFVIVPLLPVLYIPALGENTFTDRYLYLPSVGYVFLLATFLSWIKDKLPRAAKWITIVFIVIVGLYTVGTIDRNYVWQNSWNLWSDTVRRSPDSAIAHNNFGLVYASEHRFDRAIAEYQTALQLQPDYAEARFDLGNAYAYQGSVDKTIAEYQTALQKKPDNAAAHTNLGIVYSAQGQLDKAILEFQTALRLKPDYAKAHYELGDVYLTQNRLAEAINESMAALKLMPAYGEAHYNLATAYLTQNRLAEAVDEFAVALKLMPDSAIAHTNLGAAYLKQNRLDKAIKEFKTALKLNPDDATARNNLEICYQRMRLTKR